MRASGRDQAGAAALDAGDGLALAFSARGEGRLAWLHPDWLGPIGLAVRGEPVALVGFEPFEGEDDLGAFRGLVAGGEHALPVRTSVRAYRERPLLVFRSEALDDLARCATGDFERPLVAWPWLRPDLRHPGGLPPGARGVGHLYSEFALPTFSGPDLAGFLLLPVPPRPAVVEPLWIATPDGPCLMLAPLDAFHEQVIAVPRGVPRAADGVRCGWHGDLDEIPAGFASELAVWGAPGPRRALEAWGRTLRRRAGTPPRSRYADASLSHLAYWTDNGAAYWYRSEPGLDVPTTLERTLEGLREKGVPVRAVELDSWFYPHETTRPLNPGASDVPPTGALAWEPRVDMLPDGVVGLRRRLGDPPLVLHARHFASASPYWERHAAWRDGARAHPQGPELFDELCAQAATWGAVQVEQDWLVESFLGVRGLRAAPGRARRWQEDLDRAAARHGLSLLWCMASPPDFFQTVTLRSVAAIRTSGDYRYLVGSAVLWYWLLHTNALARALDLPAFKDVFLSSRDGDGRDGDPHAEVEALLASLCAGPVAIGDRLGRSDPALLARTCRPDGVLLKADVPVAALERCWRANAILEPAPLLGEAWSAHPAGRWVYLVALNAHRGGVPLRCALTLAELGDAWAGGRALCWDWRRQTVSMLEPDAALDLELAPGDWDYRVLCPVLPGEIAVVGDAERYASAGDRRLRRVRALPDGAAFDVLGAPGEAVRIEGWSAGSLAIAQARTGELHPLLPAPEAQASLARDARSGRWRLSLRLGARGLAAVRLRAGAA